MTNLTCLSNRDNIIDESRCCHDEPGNGYINFIEIYLLVDPLTNAKNNVTCEALGNKRAYYLFIPD